LAEFARKRLGKAVPSAAIEAGPLAEMLLQEWDDSDRGKIQAGFQEWVRVSFRYE
jgi:hypothetical protein